MSGEAAMLARETPRQPNFWAHVSDDAPPEAIAAADEAHDAWTAAPVGQAFLARDREVVAPASRLCVGYREAMEALADV